MSEDAVAVAEALSAAIKARDADRIAALYSEDVVVWHAMSGAGQSKAANVALLADVFAVTSELGYRDIRRHTIDGGIVQQHRLAGTFSDGTPVPGLDACLVIKVDGGRITRIDEYFDSAHFAELGARVEALHAANA